MILSNTCDAVLQRIAAEYLISRIEYVDDLAAWAAARTVGIAEPGQPVVICVEPGGLVAGVRKALDEDMLEGVVRAMAVRWSLTDNAVDMEARLNSTKKRLAFCFLKEYARTIRSLGGDELREDEWTIHAMDRLGFFLE